MGQAVRDYAIQPVPFTRVKLTDRFWDPKIRVNATVTIPYILDKCRREGRVDNFLRASKKLSGDKMTEFPFDDTDLYKLIEGASYSLQEQPNAVLERQVDTLIGIIAGAQEADGYLYTFRTVNSAHPHSWIGDHRWEKEEELSHELYNSGHLYEAAVAHYQATGKRSLLDVALKNADLLVKTFGYGKEVRYPGHQIVEMGLVKLYRVTGEKKYLDLARFFLDIRGGGDAYNQADKKVTDQHTAEGHAVRAAYMYTGMADVAALTGDPSYLRAIDDIWDDVVNKKLYVTGGIGATGNGEAFGDAYDLPNMSAYAETCAAIGNVYWNIRMFLLHGDAKYIDVLEKTLYNGLLSGMSLGGNRFFYPNPLASMGQHMRSSWFSCACCITNMTRFLPSVPGYVYAREGDNVYVNLFMSNQARIALKSGEVKVTQQTDYPWNGRVMIAVDPEGSGRFDLRVRIPGWAVGQAVPGDLYSFAEFTKTAIPITVNGQAVAYKMEKGYAVIRRGWKKGDRVVVDLPMPVEKVVANEQVKADRGRFALQKGPIVYCLEGVDHKDSVVQSIVVDKKAGVGSVYEEGLLRGVTVLTTEGLASARGVKGSGVVTTPEAVKAIPYYSWNNRGAGEMEVWIPYEASAARPKPAPTIASGSVVSASLYNKRMYSALNDQYDPVDSKDNSALYLHWWPKKDSEEWVQYDFSKEYTVSSSKVYWFDDGPWGGCRVPAWWKLYYKKGGQWVPVENSTPYGVEKDKYNEVGFVPVRTTALRLVLKLPADNSAGIHEWSIGEAEEPGQAEIQVDPGMKGAAISPTLHGIFFEEISHAGEGGLYAEMIQNRGFEDSRLPPGTSLQAGSIVPVRTPHFMLPGSKASDWTMPWNLGSQWPGWSGGAGMRLSLTDVNPLNDATPHSLRVAVDSGRAELVNSGFWGMNVVEGERYLLSFYVRDPGGYKGVVTASLRSEDGKVLAAHVFSGLRTGGWRKYGCTLQAGASDVKARFVLEFGGKGELWLDFVSLFPEKTFRGRPNGMRADLAQYIVDMKPAFIRWPGGCYVEGINIQSAPDWKRTLGPVEKRPGTYSPWGYWSSDGFGYDEYLRFCEDIGAAALYVFNAGVSCEYRSGTYIPDDSLGPVIQNALDAIEYAIGPVDSRWGRVRATAGHPAPYPLKYVEVGNEQHGSRYAQRYNRFYEAIRNKYPAIRIIASMGIGDVNRNTLDSMRAVDIADEHAYKGAYWSFNHFNHFDKYKRGSWEMYVGEYATNGGVGKGNMAATLSDAVYMMAMEKNSDLVKMSSYAPLLVNVNDVSWPVNLINFDAGHSYARISYYAIRMFNENRPDVNLGTTVRVEAPGMTAGGEFPGSPVPQFSGGIGLGTWDTQTDYKDIKVEQDGKVVYESDLLNRAGEWLPVRGDWKAEDGAMRQTAAGAQLLAVLKDRRFDSYTLTLKARKRSGYNAFIIPFAVKDSNTYLRAHIGCYVNSHSVFERVTDGNEVVNVSDPVRLQQPIDTGRWYMIRLEVKADRVDCFLDGRLVMSYTEPGKLFAISGRDSVKGDIIVKVVNAAGTAWRTRVRVGEKVMVGPEASLTTVSTADEAAENSFEHPTEHIPVTTVVGGVSNNFELELKPYSVNVLRLKDMRWNK